MVMGYIKGKGDWRVHLTVKVAGVTFKNPILPAASEMVFNGESARRVAESGVGGMVTKTFTSSPEFRVRPRPYQFPLARFDPAFKKSGSFYSLASPHVEDMNVVMEKNIPEIAQVCRAKESPSLSAFTRSLMNWLLGKKWLRDSKKLGPRCLSSISHRPP